MKTISIQKAAEKLKVSEDEVKRMCKSGSLEVVGVPGSVPEVHEQSVFEFLGEEYVEPKPNKKRAGRQPNVLTYEEAAERIGIPLANIYAMVQIKELEEWELPGSSAFGVTKRSVQAHIKSMLDAHAAEESVDNEEKKEVQEDVAIDKETAEDSPPPVEEIDQKAGTVKLLKPHEQLSDFYPQKIITVPDMYTSDDLQAAAKIARMEGELAAYRSMQSFERRA